LSGERTGPVNDAGKSAKKSLEGGLSTGRQYKKRLKGARGLQEKKGWKGNHKQAQKTA